MRAASRHFHAALACAGIVAASCAAGDAYAQARRHHVTLGLGVQKFLEDDFENSGVETAGLGHFAYRYTIKPGLDVGWEFRGTLGKERGLFDIGAVYDGELTYTTTWVGPGVRLSGGPSGARHYVQANVYFAEENFTLKVPNNLQFKDKEDAAGAGLQVGVDVRLSSGMSLPIEVNWLVASPEFNLRSVGASVGLALNFGGEL